MTAKTTGPCCVGDVALLLAEWINETSGPTDEAMRYLNMIRERAGVVAYTLRRPVVEISVPGGRAQRTSPGAACENQRWFDLMRWDVAVSTINNFFSSEIFYLRLTTWSIPSRSGRSCCRFPFRSSISTPTWPRTPAIKPITAKTYETNHKSDMCFLPLPPGCSLRRAATKPMWTRW